VDRIRMLDNDMIRLNTKLSMVLEYYGKHGNLDAKDVQEITDLYTSVSKQFDQTKVKERNLHRQAEKAAVNNPPPKK